MTFSNPFQRLFFIAQFANKLKFITHKITIHKTDVSHQKINSGPNFEFMLPSCRWWHNSAKTSYSDIDSKSKRLTDLELRVESRLERLSAMPELYLAGTFSQQSLMRLSTLPLQNKVAFIQKIGLRIYLWGQR